MAKMPYQNPALPVEERVADLMSRMTLKEKVAQICSDMGFKLLNPAYSQPENLKALFPDGLGRFTQYSAVGLISYDNIAAVSNRIQRYFVEQTDRKSVV